MATAINARYNELVNNEKIKKLEAEFQLKKLIEQERVKSLKIGQRIMLQQFCQEKESEIKLEL